MTSPRTSVNGTCSISQPRATLLIVTYCQEMLVGEAVRAALAQDYPNLQIIISDDQSPDGTFAAARRAVEVSGLRERHTIMVRQPSRNLGLIPHLYEAAALADGELLIVGAGDDISYPQRVSRLVETWLSTDAFALCSGWDVIDEAGKVCSKGCVGGKSDLRFDRMFPGVTFTQIIGATAAYRPEVFKLVPLPDPPPFAEDLYFSMVLQAEGKKVVEVPEALVAYRRHSGAMTHTPIDLQETEAWERRTARESERVAALLLHFEKSLKKPNDRVDASAVSTDRDFNLYRSRWLKATPWARLRALSRFRDPRHRRWLLTRTLGLGPLAFLRRLRGQV